MVGLGGLGETISTLGFPIVISLILIKMNNELTDDHREEIREMRERYEKMSVKFRSELNQLHTSIGKIDNINTGGDD